MFCFPFEKTANTRCCVCSMLGQWDKKGRRNGFWTESGRPIRLELSLRVTHDLNVNREEETTLDSGGPGPKHERK